ncbi:MAG: amino acid deaminase [Gammaproteobacteria bacterium]|nr:MAG: amino acid deaminase [Gammaproteobacteria bacterium]
MNNENNFQNTYQSSLADAKGIGAFDRSLSLTTVDKLGWNILREDVSLPVAVLRQKRIAHNLAWMQQFIASYDLKLAPHGKTTMSPALFQQQLEHGAWGITLATAPQVKAAYNHGMRRILMANQLVGRANMAIIECLQRDPNFEFYCIVDSVANLDQLGEFFSQAGQSLKVLLELGVDGGRTGVRDDFELARLLTAINRWPGVIVLAGVEIYEGVLKEEGEIREFLRRAVRQLHKLNDSNSLAAPTTILTGAGSAWFDVVAEEWAEVDIGRPLDIILRPGCYLTHDVGAYKAAETRISASNPIAKSMQKTLLPALQIWAYVLSLPESGLAIMGLGKRDAAFDAGLPVPNKHYRPGQSAPVEITADWQLSAMMDQHAFLRIPVDADIAVGDMIAFDISHPCLTFDKWRQLLVVDEALNVIDLIQTCF